MQKEQGKIHGLRVQPLTTGKAQSAWGGMRRLFMSHPQSGSRETDECWSLAHSACFMQSEILLQGTEPQKFKVGPHTRSSLINTLENCLLEDLT